MKSLPNLVLADDHISLGSGVMLSMVVCKNREASDFLCEVKLAETQLITKKCNEQEKGKKTKSIGYSNTTSVYSRCLICGDVDHKKELHKAATYGLDQGMCIVHG